MRLFIFSRKNNILIRLLRSKKDRRNICYFWCQPIENERTNKIWQTLELDKTVEKGSFIKRQTSGTSSDNECQQMAKSGTTSDNEWQRVIKQKYFSGHCFCCWQFPLFLISKYPIINILSSTSICFVELFSNFSFKWNIDICDICEVLEVWWERVRLKISIL